MDTSKAVTHLGLCAGYGGIELGLKRAIPDLRTVALCEIEAFAIANLVAKMEAGLMDPAPIWPNLKTFPWEAFRDRVDILTGGYPCQPFSAAGQRKGKQDPRHLWPWIADGIRLLKPRICFFENVEGHISLGLSDVIEDLAGMGYRTTWGLFSASEVGAPHQRKRVFVLAYSSARGKLARSWSDSVLCGKRGESSGQLPIQQTGGENIHSERHIRHNSDDGGDSSKLALASSLGGAAGLSGSLQRHEGESGESDDGGGEAAWPSRPGEQQYGWEPPRVVGNTESRQNNGREPGDMGEEASQGGCGDDAADGAGEAMADSYRVDRSEQAEGREHDRQAGSTGEELADSADNGCASGEASGRVCGKQPNTRRQEKSESVEQLEGSNSFARLSGEVRHMGDTGKSRWDNRDKSEQSIQVACRGCGENNSTDSGQTQPPLGGDPDGPPSGLDYAELCVSCDNRTDELRLLGNGVVPATAERAFRTLIKELDDSENSR